MQLNFKIQKDTDSRGIGYDFCSIMHYGNLAFSNNAHFTILTRDQVAILAVGCQRLTGGIYGLLGQVIHIEVTFQYVREVNLAYGSVLSDHIIMIL